MLQIKRSPPLLFPGLPSLEAVLHQNKTPKNRLVFQLMLCVVFQTTLGDGMVYVAHLLNSLQCAAKVSEKGGGSLVLNTFNSLIHCTWILGVSIQRVQMATGWIKRSFRCVLFGSYVV